MPDRLTVFHVDMNFVCLREDYLRSLLERVASFGFNAILWELEDKVRWDTCPDIAWPEAMDKPAFRDLLAYSRGLGLEPIPLLQTVGHGEYVMKHASYAALRERADRPDCYCTSNPEARALLRSLAAEYVDLFGDLEFFHFGGDEAYVFGTCPECRAAVAARGANALYAEHIEDIAAPALAAGVRPGIWSDMVMKHPEQVGAVDRRFVLWDWNYWDGIVPPQQVRVWSHPRAVTAGEVDEKLHRAIPELLDEKGDLQAFYAAAMLKRLGYDVVLCSAARSAGDSVFCPRQPRHAANIVGAARRTARAGLLGNCVTSWAVRMACCDLHELELALAPAAAAAPDMPYEELLRSVGHTFFGVDPAPYFRAVGKLTVPFPFAVSGGAAGSGIQWNGLKDPVPPPAGFLERQITDWRRKDGGERYAELRRQALDAEQPIAEGLEEMRQFSETPTTPQGRRQSGQWVHAGELQLRMNELARNVFAAVDGECRRPAAESASQARTLKSDFETWAGEWMTPKSAANSARIVFDHLVEFFADGT